MELGTLFVDEGFGTLDEDTLDGVLDILDNLRDGGRAVGIVSHVAELRTRVPAQLRVRKERRAPPCRRRPRDFSGARSAEPRVRRAAGRSTRLVRSEPVTARRISAPRMTPAPRASVRSTAPAAGWTHPRPRGRG